MVDSTKESGVQSGEQLEILMDQMKKAQELLIYVKKRYARKKNQKI